MWLISTLKQDANVIDLNFGTLIASFFENQIHVLQADRPFPFSLFFFSFDYNSNLVYPPTQILLKIEMHP